MDGFNRKKKYLLLLIVLILSTVFFVIQINVQLERESNSTLNIGELKILGNLSALSREFEGFISKRMVLDSSKNKTQTKKKKQKKKSDFYFFEKYISDGIGAFRELPDTRDEVCKERVFNVPNKSKVSVIIVFRNEARSTLLRTILSVLQRTPQRFLKEIIVVDDFGEDETALADLVKLPLGAFIKPHRNSQHTGLIESRNLGAKLATGDYIVFLDSHSEVNVGWIEPLLERLSSFPGMAVSPVLDSIDATTFQYRASSKYLKGGFNWDLHFRWIPMGEEEREAKNHPSDPFASPTFAGGVFMISRNWFSKLNGFNPLLKVWGGESIEMSIKLWLCGGQIEIVPCSRVGHVFRNIQHQSQPLLLEVPNGQQQWDLRNRKVIADSWLDEYKYFFSASDAWWRPAGVDAGKSHEELKKTLSTGHDSKLVPLPPSSSSSSLRAPPPPLPPRPIQRIKQDLHCRPFSWFLQTVFQQLKLPNTDYIAFGKLSSGQKCLKTVRAASGTIADVVLENCYHGRTSHWFLSRKDGRLVSDTGHCLSVRVHHVKKSSDSEWLTTEWSTSATHSATAATVELGDCNHSKGGWTRLGGKLIHENTQLCLDNPRSEVVTMRKCRRGAPSQLFRFSVEMQR